ncbi:hypothetical protein HK100_011384 [Physocladia obscura]|uniref:Uncharacterized protein n=1 Tax=Physocladia obscura TaxID=109957 RepID=A0AAD5TFZ4_9FUNG|nr:hypothetical protein HK100_011384 [Physocladia obscura]
MAIGLLVGRMRLGQFRTQAGDFARGRGRGRGRGRAQSTASSSSSDGARDGGATAGGWVAALDPLARLKHTFGDLLLVAVIVSLGYDLRAVRADADDFKRTSFLKERSLVARIDSLRARNDPSFAATTTTTTTTAAAAAAAATAAISTPSHPLLPSPPQDAVFDSVSVPLSNSSNKVTVF